MTARADEVIGVEMLSAAMHESGSGVELAVPKRGFHARLDQIYAFHRELDVQYRRGRRQRRGDQEFIRYCFVDPAHADAFADRFDGTRIQSKAANE